MLMLSQNEPLAVAVVEAIRSGHVQALQNLLAANPRLAEAKIAENVAEPCDSPAITRTLLHIASDWPGHIPNGAAIVAVLVEAGADVNARFTGPHGETPLHWAASNDDIEMLDALLDAGAELEASGAVIAGGTPLDDAVAFGQWRTARRLVERGAQLALWHAAALGLMEAMETHFAGTALSRRYPWGAGHTPPPDETTVAFWCACHGGQRRAAAYLLERGAELNWIAVWDGLTPLDAARRAQAIGLADWLIGRGAKPAVSLG